MSTALILDTYKTGYSRLAITYIGNNKGERSKPPKRAFGELTLKGLTNKAKRSIKAGCMHLEHYNLVTHKKNTFITLTSPEVCTDTEIKAALTLLLKRMRSKYGEFMYLWVLEIQTKRLKNTGERVPHLHLVTSMPYYDVNLLRSQWLQCLNKATGRVNELAFVNIQNVKRSLSAYMSKYLSKVEDTTTGNNWRVSKKLRQYMKPETSVIKRANLSPDDAAQYVYDNILSSYHVYIHGNYFMYFIPLQSKQVKEIFTTFAEIKNNT